jgi:predicted dinucleotide-binding enzyme
MKIGIVGSGVVGQVVGSRLVELGHEVVLGTRDPAKLDEKKRGADSLRGWVAGAGSRARVGTFSAAAAHGEIVVNATHGQSSLAALRSAGETNLAGKILIDIANELDASKGMPPLAIARDAPGGSLGERIQAAFSNVKVVKALNTMNANVMVDPQALAGGDHTAFICGNDQGAKATVRRLLESLGWRDVVDLGDITAARGMELLLPIWLRLWGKLGSIPFNFKIAR